MTLRKRSANQRVRFMFASLAIPSVPSVDDVVDILCRVPYPRVKERLSGDLARRPVEDLEPVARRLVGTDEVDHDQQKGRTCDTAIFEQLAGLVAALYRGDVGDFVGGEEDSDEDRFVQWAVKVMFPSAKNTTGEC